MPGCQGYREDGTAFARCRKCLAEPGLQKVSVSAAIVSFLRCSKHWMRPSGVGVWAEGDGEKCPDNYGSRQGERVADGAQRKREKRI